MFFSPTPATAYVYTLSLHDALPISHRGLRRRRARIRAPHRLRDDGLGVRASKKGAGCDLSRSSEARSEEHTSELQSRENLVCRLLLEKKNKKIIFKMMRHNI